MRSPKITESELLAAIEDARIATKEIRESRVYRPQGCITIAEFANACNIGLTTARSRLNTLVERGMYEILIEKKYTLRGNTVPAMYYRKVKGKK